MFNRILLCFDGSKYSSHAAQLALELAASQHATLEVISVVEIPKYAARVSKADPYYEEGRVYFMAGQQLLTPIADELGIALNRRIVMGNPARTIVKCAEESKADVIVLGYRGHSSPWDLGSEQRNSWSANSTASPGSPGCLGSVADQVAQHAPCPVLIVRRDPVVARFT